MSQEGAGGNEVRHVAEVAPSFSKLRMARHCPFDFAQLDRLGDARTTPKRNTIVMRHINNHLEYISDQKPPALHLRDFLGHMIKCRFGDRAQTSELFKGDPMSRLGSLGGGSGACDVAAGVLDKPCEIDGIPTVALRPIVWPCHIRGQKQRYMGTRCVIGREPA